MKNNKGFVLVESIVAAVFVMALSTFLIMNIIPLVGVYEETLNFDTADSKYDAHLVRKMILMDDDCITAKILKFPESQTQKYYYFKEKEICDFLSHINYCNMLLSEDYLDVKEIIITTYSGSELKKLGDAKMDEFSRVLQDYIKYMPTYDKNTLGFYQYTDRIIVVFGDRSVTSIELLKNYTSHTC